MNSDTSRDTIANSQYVFAKNLRIQQYNGFGQNLDPNYTGQSIGPICAGITVSTVGNSLFGFHRVLATKSLGKNGVIITADLEKDDNNVNTGYQLWRVFLIQDDNGEIRITKMFAPDDSRISGTTKHIQCEISKDNEDLTRLYVADMEHPIAVFDLNNPTHYTNKSIEDVVMTNVYPHKQCRIIKKISGTLNVGIVQYAYRLFNKRTTVSQMSPATHRINVFSALRTSENGRAFETSSGVGFQIEIPSYDNFAHDLFDSVALYRIQQESADKTSVVLIAESPLNIEDGELKSTIINDDGSTVLQQLTLEEFQGLQTLVIVPKTIAAAQSRLYIANCIDKTIDNHLTDGINSHTISATDTFGNSVLLDEAGRETTVIASEYINNVVSDEESFKGFYRNKDRECSDWFSNYYNSDGDIGGDSTNIKWRLIETHVLLDDCSMLDPSSSKQPGWTSGKVDGGVYRLKLGGFDPTERPITTQQAYFDSTGILVSDNNYSYSGIAGSSLLKSLRRGETYRFGIIYYTTNGVRSDVQWIDDIKIPDVEVLPLTVTKNTKTYARSIGIQFNVTVPDDSDIVSYQIVRCAKPLDNSKTLYQVALAYPEVNAIKSRENNLTRSPLYSPQVLGILRQINPRPWLYGTSDPLNPDAEQAYAQETCEDKVFGDITDFNGALMYSEDINLYRQTVSDNIEAAVAKIHPVCYAGVPRVIPNSKIHSGFNKTITEKEFRDVALDYIKQRVNLAVHSDVIATEIAERLMSLYTDLESEPTSVDYWRVVVNYRDNNPSLNIDGSLVLFYLNKITESILGTSLYSIYTIAKYKDAYRYDVWSDLAGFTSNSKYYGYGCVFNKWSNLENTISGSNGQKSQKVLYGQYYRSGQWPRSNYRMRDGYVSAYVPKALIEQAIIDAEFDPENPPTHGDARFATYRQIFQNFIDDAYKYDVRDLSRISNTTQPNAGDGYTDFQFNGKWGGDVSDGGHAGVLSGASLKYQTYNTFFGNNEYVNWASGGAYDMGVSWGEDGKTDGDCDDKYKQYRFCKFDYEQKPPTAAVYQYPEGPGHPCLISQFDNVSEEEYVLISTGIDSATYYKGPDDSDDTVWGIKLSKAEVINSREALPETWLLGNAQADDVLAMIATPIANVIHNCSTFSGITTTARKLDNYYGFGDYGVVNKQGTNNTLLVFNGDVVIAPAEITPMHKMYEKTEQQSYGISTQYTAFVPMESVVNPYLEYGMSFRNTQNPNYQVDVCEITGVFTQERPAFQYNPVFSLTSYSLESYNMNLNRFDSDNVTTTRIYNSNLKTQSNQDGWQIFSALDYLDADTKHGDVSCLISSNDQLYILQQHAFGKLSINERSLVQDENGSSILLGTGTPLQRIDVLSTDYGMRVGDFSYVVVGSDVFWIDAENPAIAYYSKAVGDLCVVSSVRNVFNKLYTDNLLHATYDREFNELSFSCVDNDCQFVFKFDQNRPMGICITTRDEAETIELSRCLYGITSSGNIVQYNRLTAKEIITADLLKPTVLQFVVNPQPMYTKVYDNQQVSILKRDFDSQFEKDFMINKTLVFSTDIQDSTYAKDTQLITNREGCIRYALPRVGNSKYGDRLRGRWLSIEITDNDPKKDYTISHILTKLRQSFQ